MAKTLGTSSNQAYVKKVQEDVQQYIRTKKIDTFVSEVVEEIIKYRPNYIITHVIEFLFRVYPDEAKQSLSGRAASDLHNKTFPRIPPSEFSIQGYNVTKDSDIQQDLDKYLKECQVNAIISAMIEKVLIAETLNPYATAIEYLIKEYPEQSFLGLELVNPKKSPQVASLVKEVLTNRRNIQDEDDTDDEEEILAIEHAHEDMINKIAGIGRKHSPREEDDRSIDTLESGTFIQSAASPRSRGGGSVASGSTTTTTFSPSKPISQRLSIRRTAVSSESIDVNTLKEQITGLKVYPKDHNQMKALFDIVSKSMLLRRLLAPEERTFLVKALQGPLIYPAGKVIFTQGEIGDRVFVVERGSVEVYVKKEMQFLTLSDAEAEDPSIVATHQAFNEAMKVHSYEAGSIFGQLALLHPTPRAATCIAGSSSSNSNNNNNAEDNKVTLWTLDRLTYKLLLAAASRRKQEMYFAYLKQVPILQTLTFDERFQLVDAMVERSYDSESIICEEGTVGNHNGKGEGNELFVILEGTVDCSQKNHYMFSLTTGQSFGEVTLLVPNKPRTATVKAKTACRMLVVDRATFQRILGPLEDLLPRSLEVLMQYASELPKLVVLAATTAAAAAAGVAVNGPSDQQQPQTQAQSKPSEFNNTAI